MQPQVQVLQWKMQLAEKSKHRRLNDSFEANGEKNSKCIQEPWNRNSMSGQYKMKKKVKLRHEKFETPPNWMLQNIGNLGIPMT